MKVFHSGVVDTAGLGNSHLLRTTWWMGDVALSGVLLGHGALSPKWSEWSQLKQVWPEVVSAVGGVGRHDTGDLGVARPLGTP
jgi:hypothetical protein